MTSKKKKIADNLMKSLVSDLKDVAEPTLVLQVDDFEIDSDEKTLSSADVKKSEKEKQSFQDDLSVKTSFAAVKSAAAAPAGPYDPHIQQVENLRIAQNRILDLEKHLEKIRQENEQLNAVADASRNQTEDLQTRMRSLEKAKTEIKEQAAIEINIYKDNLANKDFEFSKAKMKVEELESRLQVDLKKIRVRERELENRMELLKAEKSALLRTKDETILDLKRRIDQLTSEIENYKVKCVELNQKIEMNNDQFARTVRALRLALTNLEASENTGTMTIAPFKKAE